MVSIADVNVRIKLNLLACVKRILSFVYLKTTHFVLCLRVESADCRCGCCSCVLIGDRCGVVASLVRSIGPGCTRFADLEREKKSSLRRLVLLYFAASGGLLTYENNWKIATE